jgi:hypothetical protein
VSSPSRSTTAGALFHVGLPLIGSVRLISTGVAVAQSVTFFSWMKNSARCTERPASELRSKLR